MTIQEFHDRLQSDDLALQTVKALQDLSIHDDGPVSADTPWTPWG